MLAFDEEIVQCVVQFVRKVTTILIFVLCVHKKIWVCHKTSSMSNLNNVYARSLQHVKFGRTPCNFIFMRNHVFFHSWDVAATKVIIEKSSGGRFLWNRNWDLGWIWAGLATFEAGFFMFSWAKFFFNNIADGENKSGLTFGHLREKKGWSFDLKIIFFKQKQDFVIFI